MARTTGYTATAVATLFLEGLFTEKGVFPPELIGKHEVCFQYILNYLNGKKYKKETTISSTAWESYKKLIKEKTN